MASVITATTSSGLTQSADNSGVLQLASGTGNLVTVPSVTGTAMVSGNMPAFSANANTTQSLSAATWTKVNFANERFDTNNNFASSRFTPTVAGYYQINASVYYASSPAGQFILHFYVNGNDYQELGRNVAAGAGGVSGGAVIYFNGTTDYVEVYAYSTGANTLSDSTNSQYVNFSGAMVRSA